MGPEILEWALGALGTTATIVGAVKSMGRRSTQSVGDEQDYEEVSLVHDAARCWCGRAAADYDHHGMRYVCVRHLSQKVQSIEPQTEPLELCEHDRVAGQCRDCYLDARYQQQQQRMVAANAATVSDEEWEAVMEEEWEEEWEEPQPQRRPSRPQQAQRSVQQRMQSQPYPQRRPVPSQRIQRPGQQPLRERKGQQIQRYPRRQR